MQIDSLFTFHLIQFSFSQYTVTNMRPASMRYGITLQCGNHSFCQNTILQQNYCNMVPHCNKKQ